MFASVFFTRGKWLLMVELYIIGIVLALVAAVVLKRAYPEKEESGVTFNIPITFGLLISMSFPLTFIVYSIIQPSIFCKDNLF